MPKNPNTKMSPFQREVMRIAGRLGGNARTAATTPAERKEAARKAGKSGTKAQRRKRAIAAGKASGVARAEKRRQKALAEWAREFALKPQPEGSE